ncbi:acetyltransferase [Mucilaginibacter sp. OK098]|uniref:acetyltransferase n=1 Tax=Mucilaginibacter sp. OK098 TaxID=1855297 RepID=UPI000923B4B8|nr:acetyltransferase [Mucilaginibacter sp. OK098]SHL92992.1 sugar O-acyltransferase, sialic acid O-acetyltransferase NeuD family [Mucilaginibacter sp. OK098]
MPEKKPLILIGGGGHCKSCIEVINATGDWEIKGILDPNLKKGEFVLNYPVIGSDDDIGKLIAGGNYFLVTVGQIKSTVIRKRIYDNLKLKSAKIATVISPKAIVSEYASIGSGTIIHHYCMVNADAYIGENCIINTAAIIEHDAHAGNNNHISTCAVLNGHVILGDYCFIGSGAVVSNDIKITDNVIIGAGSVIVKNIEEPGVYAGCPAKKIGK